MTTYMLAATAVTWVDEGWVPVVFRGDSLAKPVHVTDPFTGPVGYDNAVVYARTLYWKLDGTNLSLHVNPVGPQGATAMAGRQIPVLDVPEARVVRQCFRCKNDLPGTVEDCVSCATEHEDCCDYEPELSDPVFVCPVCDSEDVMEEDSSARQNDLTINDDGTVTVHQGDGGGFDSDGFVCGSCHSPLTLPVEYEIEYT